MMRVKIWMHVPQATKLMCVYVEARDGKQKSSLLWATLTCAHGGCLCEEVAMVGFERSPIAPSACHACAVHLALGGKQQSACLGCNSPSSI
eukprot:2479625-Amphidinium_carterae.1